MQTNSTFIKSVKKVARWYETTARIPVEKKKEWQRASNKRAAQIFSHA